MEMIRYTLLIEEDRQTVKNPGRTYGNPEYETTVVTLAKVDGETAARGTALDAIIAVARDLQPVKAVAAAPSIGCSSGALYTPKIVNN